MADSFDSASVQRRANVVMRLLSLSGPETPPDEAAPLTDSQPPAEPTAPATSTPPDTPGVPLAYHAPPLPSASPPPTSAPPVAKAPAATTPPSTPYVPASGNAPPLPGAPPPRRPAMAPFLNEPTERLPVITPAAPPNKAAQPARTLLSGRRPPPARAAGRAVIVYEMAQKRPWRLLVFTACLVALTIGVILGQTEAYQQPVGRSGGLAYGAVPDAVQSGGPAPVTPAPGQQRVSAPLTKDRARVLEVASSATVLHIRTVDMGESLYDIATLDPSAAPKVTETPAGTKLEFVPTGVAGTVGAEIQLNVKVAWTLRLTGGATEMDVDMHAGGLASLELTGGASRTVLHLPKPKGTVGLRVTGPVTELAVRADKGVPVRIKLTGGADVVTMGGKTRKTVKAGTALTSGTWRGAKNRYDVTTAMKLQNVRLDRL